jgi:hypothetical protein
MMFAAGLLLGLALGCLIGALLVFLHIAGWRLL